ncbi:hypothetical protein [Streptomyces sp. NPDC058045]|uniref:hypothetical protein n=1 Tax=Streptomyces sp. NPDC058045 TaxID=3346311 RepID=UPI0036E80D44
MPWWQFALWGAGGGALVEFLSIYESCRQWQSARRTPTGKVRANPPTLGKYLDVPAHVLITLFRMGLGAGVAVLFGASGQIGGAYAAVALGFSAPSLLAQLGNISKVADAVTGANGELAAQNGAAGGGATPPTVDSGDPLVVITPRYGQGGGNRGR